MNLNFKEIRFSLPHIELSACVYGPEDGRPVIALHGWLDNAASFARLAPKLPGLRIVALDFAGHGHSGHRAPGCSYTIFSYVQDVLQVAEQLGWQRFSLLGHSLGAIVSVFLAGALPERIERLALIDGLAPFTGEAESAPQTLGEALKAQLTMADKRQPVYAEVSQAVKMRMRGRLAPVSREAAELLVQRGLMPVIGGYVWRTDSRLTLPQPLSFTRAQVKAFVQALQCPVKLITATHGMQLAQPDFRTLMNDMPIEIEQLPGGHHLHLDDDAGATLVSEHFKDFLRI